MSGMFSNAASFNQSLGEWQIGKVTYNKPSEDNFGLSDKEDNIKYGMLNMLHKSGLSKQNYDATLLDWSKNKTIPKGIILNSNNLKYCKSKEARQKLIDEYGWKIEGDELDCED
jgi:hypothetical protein